MKLRSLRPTFSGRVVAPSGTLSLRTRTLAPGGGRSNAAPAEVHAPVPQITAASGFLQQVRLDGTARPTTWVSESALDVTLTAGDLQEPRTFSVSVTTPPPGGGTSSTTLPFQVVGPGS